MNLDGPHWKFSLSFYGKPGVAELCLKLQDEHGVDVNVLLLSLFALTERGVAVGKADVRDADQIVRAWREDVVWPLRAIRRRLKVGPPPAPERATEELRTKVKKAELGAEQIEQAMLAHWVERLAAERAARGGSVSAVVNAVVDYYRGQVVAAAAAKPLEVDLSPFERALTE